MPDRKDEQPQPRPEPSRGTDDPADPLAEAELLRAQLGEALARTSRLIAHLKQHRQESKAVQVALASLRRLRPPDA